jgi:hypothetical protein
MDWFFVGTIPVHEKVLVLDHMGQKLFTLALWLLDDPFLFYDFSLHS